MDDQDDREYSVLPDNLIALIDDDEVENCQVVRIADEIVVDLLKTACGVDSKLRG